MNDDTDDYNLFQELLIGSVCVAGLLFAAVSIRIAVEYITVTYFGL